MFSLTQLTNFLIYFPGTIFVGAITLAYLCYRSEPRRLLNAWFLVVGAAILLGIPTILLSTLSDTHRVGWRLLGVIATFALGVGLTNWLLFLGWHIKSLHKRPITLAVTGTILGFALAILSILPASFWSPSLITPLKYVNTALTLLGTYMIITLLDFLLATWTYPRRTKLNGEHYLIVLGSGLKNGDQLSSLLKRRVATAVSISKQAHDENDYWPVLIMAGGQGSDETITEAKAMAAYAEELGYDSHNMRLEEKSTSTFENFQYAIDVIHEPEPTIEFVTSNFHVFRAAIYAASLKLTSRGIAASTGSFYYIRGLMREYGATVWLHRTRHLLSLILIIVLTIAIPWFYG